MTVKKVSDYAIHKAKKSHQALLKLKEHIVRIIKPKSEDDYECILDTFVGEIDEADLDRMREIALIGFIDSKAQAAFHKNMISRHKGLMDRAEVRMEEFKEMIDESVKLTEEDGWKSRKGNGSFYYLAAKDKAEVVDRQLLPLQYFHPSEPALTAIKEAIEAGEDVPGARIIPGADRPSSPVIRPSKAAKEEFDL